MENQFRLKIAKNNIKNCRIKLNFQYIIGFRIKIYNFNL